MGMSGFPAAITVRVCPICGDTAKQRGPGDGPFDNPVESNRPQRCIGSSLRVGGRHKMIPYVAVRYVRGNLKEQR
jgi:hypothetical protein